MVAVQWQATKCIYKPKYLRTNPYKLITAEGNYLYCSFGKVKIQLTEEQFDTEVQQKCVFSSEEWNFIQTT